MGLHWSIADVHDHQALIDDDRERAITTCLVFLSMPLGFHTVTDKNWERLATRLHVWQTLEGGRLQVWNEADDLPGTEFITASDLHRRIGLSTNASTITDAQFRKNIIAKLERGARYGIGQVDSGKVPA